MSVDFSKFKFNSRQKIDQIVFSYAGTVSGSGGVFSLTLNHSLGYTPLAFGSYSVDGTTWSDADFYDLELQTNGGSTWSSSTQIGMDLNLGSGTSVQVRLFALAPSDIAPSQTPPAPTSKFYINSNNYYDALFATGKTTLSPSSTVVSLYAHNLGYVPRVAMWTKYSSADRTMKLAYATWTTFGTSAEYYDRIAAYVDTSALKFLYASNISSEQMDVNYRIYRRRNG